MSAFSAVMAMVNWHIGTALYTFPTIYREFGVLSATTALVMCAVMTVAVYALLDRASVGCRLTHFVDVTNKRLGQHAGCACGERDWCILLLLSSSEHLCR